MRTTIEINDELLRLARRCAADEGVSLRQIVETALRFYLEHDKRGGAYRLQSRVESGSLEPGIDLDDRDSFFDK